MQRRFAPIVLLVSACGAPHAPPPVRTAEATPPEIPPDRAVEIAVGDDTTCAGMASGKVRCWGNRTQFEPLAPVQALEGVHGLAISVSEWAERICGVRGAGDVVCLVLGDGKREVEAIPVHDAREVVAAGPNRNGFCALGAGGAVTCWAQSLGYRSRSDDAEKIAGAHPIEGIPPLVSLQAGTPTCGETETGKSYCWSFEVDEARGSMETRVERTEARDHARGGDGGVFVDADGRAHRMTSPTEAEAAPWDTPPLREIRATRFMCGITEHDGRVVCGAGEQAYLNESNGVLGLGHRDRVQTGTWGVVKLPTAAEHIAVGSLHACALAGGEVYCWGNNDGNQLARERRSASLAPTRVPIPERVHQIATHFESTCAVVDSDRVYCWGDEREFPKLTLLSERAKRIAVTAGNDNQICGYTSKHVWCRYDGQPFIDLDVDSAVEIAAGFRHLCWRDSARRVFCAGEHPGGEATTRFAPEPFPIQDLVADRLLSIGSRVCAETTSGIPRAVPTARGDSEVLSTTPRRGGRGIRCLEEDGEPAGRFTPNHAFDAYHPLFSSFEQLCGVKDRALYCIDFVSGQSDPVLAVSPFDAGDLSIGTFHSCSLQLGKVACWGSGSDGQSGYWGRRDKPTPLALPFAVEAIAAGRSHTCFLADGAVHCIGSNQSGQMASAPTDDVFPSPVRIELPKR